MNAENYYEILGISKSSDENEIKKSYKKLCLQHHPDKGGDQAQFQKIQKAYEVLSDERKRSIYDQTGADPDQVENGNENGGMPFGGVDIGNIFMNMFGGGMSGGMPFGVGGAGKRRKGPMKVHEIPVSLYDFYHGKTIKLQFEQQKFCGSCKGEGCKTTVSCSSCNGRGMVEQMMMLGPGMAAVNRSPCVHCRATGKQNSGTCGTCNGKRYFKKEKILDVKIEAGMSHGDSLTFQKECSDDIQYEEAGDVKIVIIEADSDSSIRRVNNDLHSIFKIPFKDSLLGTIYETMEHPGHKEGFKILIPKGTMNNEVLCIDNEGMPKRNTKQFGNFYLKVIIDISDKDKQILKDNEETIKKLFTYGD